jgi:hypothetical protein
MKLNICRVLGKSILIMELITMDASRTTNLVKKVFTYIQIKTTTLVSGRITQLMAMESLDIIKEYSMLENGSVMSKMALGKSTGRMVLYFEGYSKRVIRRGVSFLGQTTVIMRDSSSMTNSKVKAYFFGKTTELTREAGKPIKCMVLGYLSGLTGKYFQEIT